MFAALQQQRAISVHRQISDGMRLFVFGGFGSSLASFVYWGVYDQSGASFILVGTAGLFGMLMNSLRKPNPDRPIVVHPAKCRLGAKS